MSKLRLVDIRPVEFGPQYVGELIEFRHGASLNGYFIVQGYHFDSELDDGAGPLLRVYISGYGGIRFTGRVRLMVRE